MADFHALRHSFVTLLADGGVHPKTAQDLARHSDINLTMNRYTHTLLEKQSEALAVLPDFDAPVGAQTARATGTDGDSCLAQNGQADPIQDDSSRRSEAEIGRGAGTKKGPANTIETQHPQGLNQMVTPGGIEPPFPDRKSGNHLSQQATQESLMTNEAGRLALCLSQKLGKHPELHRITEAWETLPDAVKAGILAMVKAVDKTR